MQPIIFTEAVQLLLKKQVVNETVGVKLELLSETLWLWRGVGRKKTNDGVTWEGLGALGDITGLEFGPSAAINPIVMTLSGLDADLARAARQQITEVRGRRVSVYALVFDGSWAPVDMPYLCQLAVIERISIQGAADKHVLELRAEPLFSSKHIAPLSLVSDEDQQARYPGDTALERVTLNQTLYWAQ